MRMSLVEAAIVLHVGAGAAWALATLAVAVFGRARVGWLRAMLAAALVNLAAGIYLWHGLHAGPWGRPEHLLATGTFCAFVALGMQAPVALTSDGRRLAAAPLLIYRMTALLLLAAAAAMLASTTA